MRKKSKERQILEGYMNIVKSRIERYCCTGATSPRYNVPGAGALRGLAHALVDEIHLAPAYFFWTSQNSHTTPLHLRFEAGACELRATRATANEPRGLFQATTVPNCSLSRAGDRLPLVGFVLRQTLRQTASFVGLVKSTTETLTRTRSSFSSCEKATPHIIWSSHCSPDLWATVRASHCSHH